MSTSTAYKHYLRAVSLWPKDPFRPEIQFRDALRRRADRRFPSATSVPSSTSQSHPPIDASNAANAAPVATAAVDEAAEMDQINALYSLLEGRYETKYSLQNSLLSPKSDPDHYTNLMKELNEAPTRTFWRRMAYHWKGFLRFT